MASDEQRTFIYLNFDIDPFTAELVFPQGVPKGGSVCLVFGAFQKGEPVNKATKFTEEFARMVSQKFRVSSPLVEGSPQCFIRISLVKDGAQMPQVPRPNKTVSLLKKPVLPVPPKPPPPPQQQNKRALPSSQFPSGANEGEENEEDVDDVDGSAPSGKAGQKARVPARSRVLAKRAGQVPAKANGAAADRSDSEGEASVGSQPISPFDDAEEGAGVVSDGDEVGTFSCAQCLTSFHFESELQKHLALEHGVLEECKHCTKKFPNKFTLVRHMWSHLPRNRLPFRCSECKKGFITKRELLGHKAKPHTKKVRLPVEIASKTGARAKTHRTAESQGNSEELSCPERHSYSSPGEEEIFFCEFCSEVYLTGHFYRQHVSKHHAEKLDAYPDDYSLFSGVEKDPADDMDGSKFRCTICDKYAGVSFREVCSHIFEEHPNSGVYACRRCTLVFCNEEEYAAHNSSHVVKVTPSQTVPGFKDYHCNVCSEVMTHRKTLVRHLQQHHRDPNVKPYACGLCPSRFRGKASLYIHTRKHNTQVERRRFPCTKCPKVFTAKQFLKRHEEAVHARLLPFACAHCSKRFYFERHLQQHLVMSHRSKLSEEEVASLGLIHNFQCEECGFSSYSERTIRRHVYSHTGTYPFTCDVCNRGFVFRFELTAHHARRHLHQKLHCHLCSRIFFIKERFDKHLSAHEEKWGFTCTVCGQLFETQGYLENHQLRHSGKTPYECTDCGKRFSAPQGLTFHKQQHHHAKRPRQQAPNSRMENWPLGCDVCGIRFKYLSSQQAHMAFHHPSTEGESLQCSYCQRKLGSKLALSQHLRKHTNEKYKCKHCDRCFQSYVGCRTHQVVMHTRRFKVSCPFCSKGCVSIFDLKRHLKNVHNAVVLKEQSLQMTDSGDAIELMDESMVVGDETIHVVGDDETIQVIGQEGMQIVDEGGIEVVGEGDIHVVGQDGIQIVSTEQAMEIIAQEGMEIVNGQFVQAVGENVQVVSEQDAPSGNEMVLLELRETPAPV